MISNSRWPVIPAAAASALAAWVSPIAQTRNGLERLHDQPLQQQGADPCRLRSGETTSWPPLHSVPTRTGRTHKFIVLAYQEVLRGRVCTSQSQRCLVESASGRPPRRRPPTAVRRRSLCSELGCHCQISVNSDIPTLA